MGRRGAGGATGVAISSPAGVQRNAPWSALVSLMEALLARELPRTIGMVDCAARSVNRTTGLTHSTPAGGSSVSHGT